jgi:hypothetical protein
MVRITMTAAMVAAIERCAAIDKEALPLVHREHDPPLDNPEIGQPISHGQVTEISRYFKKLVETGGAVGSALLDEGNTPMYHMDQLLKSSKVYMEPPMPKQEPVSGVRELAV